MLALGLFLPFGTVGGQFTLLNSQNFVTSVSGQFAVVMPAEPGMILRDPDLAADTNLVRLKPALLAVAAERFKISLWQQLGLPPNEEWSGKIYLRIHPARFVNETVSIASSPLVDRWNYAVDLPDRLTKTRYARALTGVLLLELANRTARPGGHSAELPDWLVDGLAQQLMADEEKQLVLSTPLKREGDLPITRIVQSERGYDPLAACRQILQNAPALTFDELSWPTDAQMNGEDGGVYFASAQLFQSELLELKNGREKMQAMLADLPNYYNWQTAFFHAFGDDFQRPLDVEKWWALRVVNFAASSPGPRWTAGASMARLDDLMGVPVEYRSDSNAMPAHAEISLQDALKNLDPDQEDTVLRVKIRDLALVELRLAPPFGELADGYRMALSDYLGETSLSSPANFGSGQVQQIQLAPFLAQLGKGAPVALKLQIKQPPVPVAPDNPGRGGDRMLASSPMRESTPNTDRTPQESPAANRHGVPPSRHASLEDTLKKLDALDGRRRDAESRLMLSLQQPSSLGAP